MQGQLLIHILPGPDPSWTFSRCGLYPLSPDPRQINIGCPYKQPNYHEHGSGEKRRQGAGSEDVLLPECLWPGCTPLTFGGLSTERAGGRCKSQFEEAARGFSSMVKVVQIPIHGTGNQVKHFGGCHSTGLRGWGSAGRGLRLEMRGPLTFPSGNWGCKEPGVGRWWEYVWAAGGVG